MRIRWAIWATVLVGAVGLFGPVVAASSSFSNGAFNCSLCSQSGYYVSNATSSGFYDISSTVGENDMAPWTVTANSVDWIDGLWQAPPGSLYSLDMNGLTNGTIQQTFSTVSGANYFVSFELSGNSACGPVTKILDVNATGGSLKQFSFDTQMGPGSTYAEMNWTAEGYTFTASGTSTTITFAGDSTNTSACGPALGDVAVTQVAASGAQCKDGGWMLGVVVNGALMTFTNQGQCVSYFATSGDTPIGS